MQGEVGVNGWEGNTRIKTKGTELNISSSPDPEAAMQLGIWGAVHYVQQWVAESELYI